MSGLHDCNHRKIMHVAAFLPSAISVMFEDFNPRLLVEFLFTDATTHLSSCAEQYYESLS